MKTHLKTSFSIHLVCMMMALYLKSSFCRCHLDLREKKNLFQLLFSKDCVLLGSLTRGCAGHGTEEVEVWMSTAVIDLAIPSPGL